eukprot:TRINITY_DN41223_c0_g1_i1.p1 TRINITY_DN41223_c0_g1~~TRINITY_DN41223_c0_g1_i1.p1  ORF type:complete len:495 (+),score=73.22 TRINITY_DN41223_c0_g1_i1:133-1617(+)
MASPSKDRNRSKKSTKTASEGADNDFVLHNGRRSAVHNPNEETLMQKTVVHESSIVDDGDSAKKFTMTINRKNPMAHELMAQMKVERQLANSGSGGTNSLAGPGGITFAGKIHRNFLTGKVYLKHNGFNENDFVITDLYTRRSVCGTAESLLEDPYLFKPVPMMYRTWLYNNSVKDRKNTSSDDAALLAAALSVPCIDAPVNAGRWSPVMAAIISGICVTTSGDEILVIGSLAFVAFMWVVSTFLNDWSNYRELRAVLIVPRIIWNLFVIFRCITYLTSGTLTGLIGIALSIACSVLDWFMGDREQINCYKLHCTYEIVRKLRSRVFICRRFGAADLETMFGDRGSVQFEVSGYGKWDQRMIVITEIFGILFELRPLSKADAVSMLDEYAENGGSRLVFHGIDCYDDLCPTWIDLERTERFNSLKMAAQAEKRQSAETKMSDDDLLDQAHKAKAFKEEQEALLAQKRAFEAEQEAKKAALAENPGNAFGPALLQ